MAHDYWKWWDVWGDTAKNSNLWLKYVGNTMVEFADVAGANFTVFNDFTDNNLVKRVRLFISQSRLEYNIKKVNLDKHFDATTEGTIEQSIEGTEEAEAAFLLKGYLESDLWCNERMASDTNDYINSDPFFAQIGPALSLHQKHVLLMQMAKRSAYEVQGDKYKVYPLRVTFNWGYRYDRWRALMEHLKTDRGLTHAQARNEMRTKYMPYYFRNWDWNATVPQSQLMLEPIAEKVELRCEPAMIDNCRVWEDGEKPNRYPVELSFLVRIDNIRVGSEDHSLDDYVVLLGAEDQKPANRSEW